jgi:hypothetical protein
MELRRGGALKDSVEQMNFYKDEAIALRGSFSAFDMECLYPALESMEKGDVYLEVGVQYGRSLNFARKYSKGEIYGVDIDDEKYLGVKGANFIHKSSDEAVKDWTLPIKVLFIDGDHSYEGVKADWDNFSPFVKDGGWVLFHDCDETSPGVVKLFDEIKLKDKQKSDNQRCSMAWGRM